MGARRLIAPFLGRAATLRAIYSRARRRWPLVDEVHRAYDRYYELRLNRLAGSAVYFGFLAALPFVLLLFFAVNSVTPEPATIHHTAGADAVQDAMSVVAGPGVNAHGLAEVWDTVLHAVLTTFGISGLLYAAWSWFESLRHAVATAAGRVETRRRMRDFVTATTDLMLAGPGLLLSVLLAWSFTTTPYRLLDLAHVEVPEAIRGWLEGDALVLCLLWSTVLWYVIYPRLARTPTRRGRTLAAAVATSLALGLMLELGMAAVKENTDYPLFGILVVVFGLLVWVSMAVRLVVAVGTWLTLPPSAEPGSAEPAVDTPAVPLPATAFPVVATVTPPVCDAPTTSVPTDETGPDATTDADFATG